ncbi:hypothetical protein [Pusillimonas noertemannii]|uniref:Osmotically inducible lipoprotein OsmB n=1 Tax=Pusillimonas noertemannii TaxID=305977 RepID=A0A2U1CQ66_9BURK|nr:hypothetical protein [Pusillimonas noertemannii]NYT67310.1 hypothetical protein [Pusillimonas noertemannii]PVY67984.1 hypothetical protein C7440_0370 [Pusillimonas noertemannii]TFL12502.1 hypothetical protein CSC72_05200 [Pusillimonas noertemannii]
MNIRTNIARFGLVGLLALSMAGCANARDRKTDNTLIGAGLGAAAGAVISQGDPLYTIGGAAAGGLLGNILTEEPRYRGRDWNRGRNHYSGPPHRHVKRNHYKGHKHHHRHRH